jgi:hypothetical protein
VGALAILVAALVVPRSAEPHVVPVPDVDRREQDVRERLEIARARSAYTEPLPFEVRAVGERVRRYGMATARADSERAMHELVELRQSALSAQDRHGDQPLLKLRAVQTELFREAIRRWEASGRVDEELIELSGDFIERARANGWIARGRLVMTHEERRVTFQVRWSRLAGLLEEHPFSPTLNEWRAYYRFLIEHPEVDRTRVADVESVVMSYVASLEQHDPSYPGLLARGVLRYRAGEYDVAVRLFRAYLDERPDGPRRTWARNHLLAAARRAQAGGGR